MTQFSELGLAAPLVRALDAAGYTKPTPIQLQAIPPVLEGRDLCGIAQTGTGKTAAFALPILHYLSENNRPRPVTGCRVLVLSPTRELASQIADSFRKYGQHLRLSVATVFGGVPIGRQVRQLQGGVDVLVATPGRLLDLIDQRALSLSKVEVLVLDEADQMLDLGFIHSLKRIVTLLPKQRQTLFFSATMPRAIAELGDRFLSDPVKVSVAPVASTAERVEQFVTFINQAEKQALLTLKLREAEIDRALVFTRTKHGADRVVKHLAAAGVRAEAIHGNKSQPQRERTLAAFRSGEINVLVATDIAARGIDVPGVSHVFNFEIPDVPEQYVHRIGRTARAGKAGIALAFVDQAERNNIRDIERLTKVKLQPVAIPENFLAEAARLPRPSAQQARPTAQRRHDDARKAGGPAGAPGDKPKRRFPQRRRGPGVGTHKGAVRKTGA
ncbi:DEAD/DEAH box helicase [Sphingomonas quercus]|uniref:DEAD/DEAH box helicase n=1 Tax=Sphingomonas quercus TaxID=2842451 RepID=A0ABS6BLG1_9SPHN|nr:DEAD/DEAH box helicase [Sphingomonas quercus]MBU3079157.1 DEAD/DEAH box helicase [Sphingomonas quercus]